MSKDKEPILKKQSKPLEPKNKRNGRLDAKTKKIIKQKK